MKKEFIFVFILFCQLIFNFSCVGGGKLTAEDHFKKGLDYDSLMNYKKAVKEYQAAIKKNKNNPFYYIKLAEATFYCHEWRDSKMQSLISDYYNKAVDAAHYSNSPDSVYQTIYSSRLNYHFSMNHYGVVKDQGALMIKLYPKCYVPYMYIGMVLIKNNDAANGNKYLDTAYALSSDKTIVLKQRAPIEFKMGLYEKAISDYQELLAQSATTNTDIKYLCRSYWFTQKKDSACLYFYAFERSEVAGVDLEIKRYCGY